MYRLGLYEKSMREGLSLREKLTLAKKFGFDFLEISIDESNEKMERLDMSVDEKKALKDCMLDNNFFIESMCLSGHRKYPLGSKNLDIQKKSLEIMKKAIVFSRDLGVRIIQIAGYDVYYDKSDSETKQNFVLNLKKSVEIAENYGVMLAFETMETQFMNSCSKALDCLKLINSPYLKIYPDIGNITNSGVDIANDIKGSTGFIVSAHLKETKPNIFRNTKFGEGHVDFDHAIKYFKNANVKRFLAEMWDNNQDNWQDEIIEANRFLREKLNREFCI